MKKAVLIILCAVILLAALSGCGTKTGGFGEINVSSSKTPGKNEPDGPEDIGSSGGKQDPIKPDDPVKPPKPSPSPPPDTPQGDFSNENDWAAAYLEVVENLIARYGEGEMWAEDYYGGNDFMTGLGMVRLIDFDGDGTYELYCAYSDGESPIVNKQVIYGYNNGLITLMGECSVSNPGADVSPSVTFLSKYGKVYLVEIFEISDGRYYAVENGKMVTVLEYYYDFWEEGVNSVNGVPVTEDDVFYAIAEMENGGTLDCIYFYGAEYEDLIKTQEVISALRDIARP